MKELFDPNGHLTDDAFGALLRDEPARPRWNVWRFPSTFPSATAVWSGTPPSWTAPSCSPPRAGRASGLPAHPRARRKLFVNKYATAAAAACFAIMFWNIGLFNVDVQNDHGKILDALANGAATFSERTTQFTDNLSETLDKILQSLKIERGSQHEKE